ncbi:hypothetical protein G6F56_012011 [Rhizopus delemar]|nr:hypothetical protein G6F56_012011 [Rhizopus delemar]
MIIASSVKKETCIPLEPLTSNHFSQPKEEETHVTAQPRAKTQNDTMTQVFGQTGLHTQVNQTLSITGSIAHKTLNCEAFLVNETVFLSSPSIGLLNWAGHEFQSW